jgi:hypothetical protein
VESLETVQTKIDPPKLDPLQHMVKTSFQDITPVRLRLLLIANCLLALFFCLAAMGTVHQHEHAALTVGHDAAPSVVAAYEIKGGAAQMDGLLAEELLYNPTDDEALQVASSFEKWRTNVSKQLVAAARNITYGRSEQLPIENLQIAFGKYQMQAQSALDAHNASNQPVALNSYRASLETLENQLLPNADALNKANADVLESTYSEEKSASALAASGVLVIGILLIASLTVSQIYLRRKFRRRLNVPLLLATICTIIFVNHIYSELRHSAEHLKVAKEDSYNSMVAILAARSSVFDANAAQNRWLLDRAHADVHENTFAGDIRSIASFAPGHDFASTLDSVQKQLSAGEKISLPGFSGTLADELANIRFEGEGQVAVEALAALKDYAETDKRMRELEKSGNHQAAVKLGLSYFPDASKFAFSKLDDALNRTLKINQQQFENGIKSSLKELNGLDVFSVVFSLFIAICVYTGLRPRMAEYLS